MVNQQRLQPAVLNRKAAQPLSVHNAQTGINPIEKATIRDRVQIPIMDAKVIADFITFRGLCCAEQHFAIGLGPWQTLEQPNVQIYTESSDDDTLAHSHGACSTDLQKAFKKLDEVGGLILYIREQVSTEPRYNPLDAYRLQDESEGTLETNQALDVPIGLRYYVNVSQMLMALDITQIHLLSNSPKKPKGLQELGIEIITVRSNDDCPR